jgi:hypothetical protein
MASSIRELWQIFSDLRMVQKGCPSKTTKVDAAIELFLYKAGKVGTGCTYFAKVIEAMKKYLSSRGYRNFKFRYHINWKGFLETFSLQHGFHWDSINTASEEEEAKMMRVIAVVDIPFSKEQWQELRAEVAGLRDRVPEKEDCPGYNFQEENGIPLFPPSLYISEAYQNVLTKNVRKKYVDALERGGFFDQRAHDHDDEDADDSED